MGRKAQCLKGSPAAGAWLQPQIARGISEGSRQRPLLEPPQGGFGVGEFPLSRLTSPGVL